jgi:chitodextrinase
VTLSAAQTAGNLNVVAIGWDDPTYTVSSVTDTRGNTYAVAASPTVMTGERAQVMYYAKNIAAGSNTVTVTFTGSVPWPDLRVAEYSGLDTTAPLDVSASNSGNDTDMSSGSITTTNADDLLVGANTIERGTIAADANFTQRLIDSNLNILEDRIVTATGSYSASATQDPSGGWVMQMVAFKAAGSGGGGGDTQAPSMPTGLTPTVISSTQINLSWTASTDNVGVTGYRVERCAGASCSNFAEVGTPAGASFNDTGLTASTTYQYRVRATDSVPNFSAYSSIVSATTSAPGDTQAPTAPSSLTATIISSSQVNLSWTASTDNVGVTAYLIERCAGSGCSNFLQIDSASGTTYSDTTVAASTIYVYRVRARDAGNNLSGYSNTATATIATALGVLQGNSGDPQTPTSSVMVTFSGAQTAGDTNVIAIGWRTPGANIQSVTDSRGNTYMPAVGPTILTDLGAHAIYFSSGIVAAASGANTVTVTFSGSVSQPDVRIAEYGGIDASEPIDAIGFATGTGTTSSSGTISTITANTLIVGANLSATSTTGPGSGFTTRSLSSPNGNILEDRIVSGAGNYSATAPLSASGKWIMQIVAFRWIGLPCN